MLRKLLRYNPATGKLFWRERPVEMFKSKRSANAWNAKCAGEEAFATDNSYGYLVGSIFDCKYRAHRVIWAMETGEWPTEQIDHEDHDRSNNRFANLRKASNAENARNQSFRCTNTSGITGVYWSKRASKWYAQIKVDGQAIHLGYFSNLPFAAAARTNAKIKYGFHQNHGRPA